MVLQMQRILLNGGVSNMTHMSLSGSMQFALRRCGSFGAFWCHSCHSRFQEEILRTASWPGSRPSKEDMTDINGDDGDDGYVLRCFVGRCAWHTRFRSR